MEINKNNGGKKMKKLMLILVALCGVAFADMVVPATSLPKNAQDFIANNFKGANIMYVEMDYDSYDVMLSNGTEVDFFTNGDWKEVKSYMGVNPAILPAPVAAGFQKAFPNVQIIKVEKEWNGYEIKTAQRIKAYFDANGNLMGQKYDD